MEAVTSSGTAVLTLPTDEQILITREFDAPKHLVYKAFTTPELVKRWWNAKRGEVTVAEIDLRVGGRCELTMVQRRSGTEYPVRYEIVELVEPELIVLRCEPMPEMGLPDGTVTRVEFHDHGEKTRMTLSDGPYPPAGRGHAEAGWNAAFAKLAAVVAG